MRKTIQFIKPAFCGDDGKASSRRISAFIILLLVVIAHSSWLKNAFMNSDFALLPEILIIDFSFVSALFGMTTWQGIQKTKQDTPQPTAA